MPLWVPLLVRTDEKIIEMKELIDCEAEENFLNKDFVALHRIPTFLLNNTIKA